MQAGRRWLFPLIAGLLSACGGGGDAPAGEATAMAQPAAGAAVRLASEATPPPPPARGELLGVTPLGRIGVQQVVTALAQVQVPALAPVYDVDTFRILYGTVDGQQRPVVASGLLAVPRKGAGARSPAVSYQHATVFHDQDAPSNNATADQPALVLASMGYVVVAADYVGYGASKGVPHPYLLAEPMAAAVVDLLDAGNAHVSQAGPALNGQLFLVGYSQGGHATLAAHRALQMRGDAMAAAVIGSAPGAGPLDVGATLDELLARVRRETPLLAALVDPALLQHLSPSVRREVRDEMLERVLPEDADITFDSRFLDNFLVNDRAAFERDSNVHRWRPDRPVRLFHGHQDQTVPFVASANAWHAMNAIGAPDVQLMGCGAVPSSHLNCVQAYWQHTLSQMALVVRDL